MFGKGVYFADMVSKSANYCYTNNQNNISCMLLCEVALGNMNEKFYADYNANILPIGKHRYLIFINLKINVFLTCLIKIKLFV